VIVLGTHFDSSYITTKNSAEFARTADRIAKLVAHDIYQYGLGDVEIITDNQFIARCSEGSWVMEEEEGKKVNIVLIGDGHQNWATQRVLFKRESEGIPTGNIPRLHCIPSSACFYCASSNSSTLLDVHVVAIDTEQGTVSIRPNGQEFQQPGTGLLMIRPWGPSNLAMVIAGLDPQGLESAARLFPKRTGMLVPDWSKLLITAYFGFSTCKGDDHVEQLLTCACNDILFFVWFFLVVTGPEMAWKGAGGILAAGYIFSYWVAYKVSMSIRVT
jgi:hypothetical protein